MTKMNQALRTEFNKEIETLTRTPAAAKMELKNPTTQLENSKGIKQKLEYEWAENLDQIIKEYEKI